MFTLTASYTDVGASGVRPLSGSSIVFLRNPVVDVGFLPDITGFTAKDSSGSKYLIFPAAEGSLKGTGLDMSGIKSLEFTGYGGGEAARYKLEIHGGSPTGTLLGEGEMSFAAGKQKVTAAVPIQAGTAGTKQDIYVVCKALQPGTGYRPLLKTIRFVPGSNAAIAQRR